jgi:hypothetical protein
MSDEPSGDTPLGIPVEVICVSCTPPIFARGRLRSRSIDRCTVELVAPAPRLVRGLRVIIDCGPAGPGRILGQVESTDGTLVTLGSHKTIPFDKRSFPRLYGGIQLRYRVVPADRWEHAARDWMLGFPDGAPEEEWRVPDPFMDFSVSGLKFEGPAGAAQNDLLLVEMRVPGDDLARRATARVVRVDPLPPTGDEPKPAGYVQTAVHFLDLPQGSAEALVRFTLQLQQVLMQLPDEG